MLGVLSVGHAVRARSAALVVLDVGAGRDGRRVSDSRRHRSTISGRLPCAGTASAARGAAYREQRVTLPGEDLDGRVGHGRPERANGSSLTISSSRRPARSPGQVGAAALAALMASTASGGAGRASAAVKSARRMCSLRSRTSSRRPDVASTPGMRPLSALAHAASSSSVASRSACSGGVTAGHRAVEITRGGRASRGLHDGDPGRRHDGAARRDHVVRAWSRP